MTNTTQQVPVPKLIWTNIIFFTVTTLIGVIGAPFYLFHYGFSTSEAVLFAFFLLATPLSITMGYHRLFAHMSYKANPIAQFLLLFFGAAAFEQSAYKWASQHRTHHQFVDTDRDPYTIKKGFFYAHIGWLIFWKQPENYHNVSDLRRNPMVMHQHRYFKFWSIGSGIVLPLLIGAMIGHVLSALIFTVCLRLTLIYHGTFCINSFCHMFGNSTYDIDSSAKDHWLAAIITFGEGYHNYHHHFPADYRNGVRWYHWDPTKWLIALMAWTGFAKDLKKISAYKINAARLRAKLLRVEQTYSKIKHPNLHVEVIRQNLLSRYEQLKGMLVVWEHHAAEYRDSVRKRIAGSGLKACIQKLSEARQRYKQGLREWEMLYSQVKRFANYSVSR